jgi:hypothetical protein
MSDAKLTDIEDERGFVKNFFLPSSVSHRTVSYTYALNA